MVFPALSREDLLIVGLAATCRIGVVAAAAAVVVDDTFCL